MVAAKKQHHVLVPISSVSSSQPIFKLLLEEIDFIKQSICALFEIFAWLSQMDIGTESVAATKQYCILVSNIIYYNHPMP